MLGMHPGGCILKQGLSSFLNLFLYALFTLLLPSFASLTAAIQTNLLPVEILHDFQEPGDQGEYVYDRVIEGTDGYLYGTALNGGHDDAGLIFKVTKDGTDFSVIHYFDKTTTNGLSPWGGVTEATDGRLYGTTRHGGLNDAGIIFSLQKDGTDFSILLNLSTNQNDAPFPMNNLLEAKNGRLYGRTIGNDSAGGSAIFSLQKNGSDLQILHRFDSTLGDFSEPYGGLIEGSDGFIYGAYPETGPENDGLVFRIGNDGSNYEVLHDFRSSQKDGIVPSGGLYESTEGYLYGVTVGGGIKDFGVLFRLNHDGSNYQILHHFIPDDTAGYTPINPPIEGPGGLLYGTTYFGGIDDTGTIYSVHKDGTGLTFLHQFPDSGPWGPYAPLIKGTDGALYGGNFTGGGVSYGAVFRIKPAALTFTPGLDGARLRLEGFVGGKYELMSSHVLPAQWQSEGTVTNTTGLLDFRIPILKTNTFFRAQISD
jgi:uncharacterized repeat protein (TIGR03803 family)